MGKLLDRYKSGEGRSKYEAYAMEYLVGYMLGSVKTGDAKAVSLTPMNIEESMKVPFVPSMFYTFMYTPQKSSGLSMYDAVPLLFVTSSGGGYVRGINFNLIPNDVRASLIDMFLDGYKSYYDNASEDDPLNEKLAVTVMNPKGLSSLLTAMTNETGIDLSMAMRTYDMKGIWMPRMIEYDMWEYIPYLSFKDAVRGGKLAQIQASLVQAASDRR